MNELALFAGAGGGILGGHLLGWRTVCAVEIEDYPRRVLLARQRDGILPMFPIWDDVKTFDGRPWRGRVDVVSGGFPCQDISCAGKGAGIEGERSGLWSEMARIIGEVRPRYASWKTHRCLWEEGLQPYSLTLPRWGSMQDGVLWERITPALPTSGTESGLWRTPDTGGGGPQGKLRNGLTHRESGHPIQVRLQDQVLNPRLWPTPEAHERNVYPRWTKTRKHGQNVEPNLAGAVMMWPTPKASVAGPDYAKLGRSKTGISLQTAVQMFPTPRSAKTTNENLETWQKRHSEGKVATPPLSLAVRMFPTPKSRDWKGRSQRGEHAPMDALPNMITGSLNPDWVELLMGWPLGWTDIDRPCDPVVRPWDAHWEDGVPRVTTQCKNRVARLKAIGNGQVPAVAALAWEILTDAS